MKKRYSGGFRYVLPGVVFLWLLCASCDRALAAPESCPAQVQQLTAAASVVGEPATSYVYELDANSARTVSAKIVADTTAGWYSWDVSQANLEESIQYTPFSDTLYFKHTVAASVPLGVIFPTSVIVRHAWVARADFARKTALGWDARETQQCFVPAFTSTATTQTAGGAFSVPTPSPLPSPAKYVTATASSAPFRVTECKTPFAAVAIEKAKNPEFPDRLYDSVTSIVNVTVDSRGNAVDTSVLASSGSIAADNATLQAAKRSTYSSGTSYCQPVGGDYWFRADFHPR